MLLFTFTMKIGEKTATSDENLVFQKIWELVMIRGTSEAICESLWALTVQEIAI